MYYPLSFRPGLSTGPSNSGSGLAIGSRFILMLMFMFMLMLMLMFMLMPNWPTRVQSGNLIFLYLM
jgi:hypothetical protein